jgi:uroporphyrinogen-III synthase
MSDLRGLRVLLTRPAEQADETAAWVRAVGGEALCCPCLVLGPPPDPGPLDRALRAAASLGEDGPAERWAWTSANAVRAVAARLRHLSLTPAVLDRARVRHAAVGARTTAALREIGLLPGLVMEGEASTAEGLAAAILHTWELGRGERVLLPRAAQGREALAEALARAGAQLSSLPAYEMAPAPPADLAEAAAALRAGAVALVPLGSPRTAATLLEALGEDGKALLGQTVVGAIGATTAAALREMGVRVDVVAAGADFRALIEEMAAHVKRKG